MLPQELIRIKRDNGRLSRTEIDEFITGITNKTIGESQIAAMAMAVFLNGLNDEERVDMTMSMAHSGITLDWAEENLAGPVLDKHSTGGVGDKVSLMLAPIVAACGAYVPMLSGRGLGHTGGTLDKMDAIPGYVTQPETETLRAVVKDVGCAIVGATHEFAPADRAMYAVRDVTGTVESIDLITASILSKKLAAGLEGLVLDVKYGSGAFMKDYGDAKHLAQTLVAVANGAGLPCRALMTDMNEVLGKTAGNAIEVREAVEFLRGDNVDERLSHVVMGLSAELLVLGKIADTAQEGMEIAERNWRNGRAADFFGRMVMDLGGPADIIENFETLLPVAPQTMAVYPHEAGVVQAIDTRALGLAVIELGGGRRLVSDTIDHGVGLGAVASIGEVVGPGGEAPLAVIYGRSDDKIAQAEQMIRAAYTLAPVGTPVDQTPVIAECIALS